MLYPMLRVLSLKDRIIDILPYLFLLLAPALIPLMILPSLDQPLLFSKEIVVFVSISGAAVCWLLRGILHKRFFLRRTIIDIPLLVIFFCSLVSLIFAADKSIAFFGASTNFVLHGTLLISFLIYVWLCLQEIRTLARTRAMIAVYCFSSALAAALFLIRSFGWGGESLIGIGLSPGLTNTVTLLNSGFGIYMLMALVISLGIVATQQSSRLLVVAAFAAIFLEVVVLLRIDFSVLWVLCIITCVALAILSWYVRSSSRILVLSLVVGVSFFGLFAFFSPWSILQKETLPAEVSVSSAVSWHIISEAAQAVPKFFLIGAGPGHFESLFLLYRPDSFNLDPLAWSIRFQQPYNTLFDIMVSMGLFGISSMAMLLFMTLGSIFAAIKAYLRHERHPYMLGFSDEKKQVVQQAFFLVIAWIILTIGMGILYYDIALWFSWWFLLALIIIGLGVISPALIKEKKPTRRFSEQYVLLLWLLFVVCLLFVSIRGVFMYRHLNAAYWYSIATNSVSVDKKEQAIAQALTFRPNYPVYQIALAQILLEKAQQEARSTAANEQLIARLLAGGIDSMKTLTAKHPTSVNGWETLALLYMNSRTFAPNAITWAIDAWLETISLDPHNPLFYWQLGRSYEAAEQYSEAINAYERAIEEKKDYVPAYMSIGLVFETQTQYHAAIDTYLQLLEEQPRYALGWYQLGRVYFNRAERGDYTLAQDAWQEAIRIDPLYVDALYSLGLLKEQQGKPQEARRYYQNILQIDQTNKQAQERLSQ